jgi:hypothetical protein
MGEWRYRSTILDIGTRRRWVVSFTSQWLYPRERAPGTHWIGSWVGPRAGLEAAEYIKSLPPIGNRTPVVHPIACRPVYRKANSCSENTDFYETKFFFQCLKGTSLGHILSLSIPVHIFTCYFLGTIIVLSSHLRLRFSSRLHSSDVLPECLPLSLVLYE